MKISPKHGLNPTISVCFFCGRDKDEILVNGYLKGDAEAPKRAVANYEPCEECKEKFKEGTLIVEATEQDNGGMPIQEGVWPTGRWCLISHESCKRIFNELHDTILLEDVAYQLLMRDVVQ